MTDTRSPEPTRSTRGAAGLVRRRPVGAFLLVVVVLSIPLLTVPVAIEIPVEPFLLVLVYVVLLGSTVVLTRVADGSPGVRRLFSRVLIWRFGVARWLVILLGMPVLTLAVADLFGASSRKTSMSFNHPDNHAWGYISLRDTKG